MKQEIDFTKGKRGALLPSKGKTRITIFIDDTGLSAFRARRKGRYRIANDDEPGAEGFLMDKTEPVTESVLRQVIREKVPNLSRAAARAGRRGTKRRAP
jgi:hypothetical protein